MGILEHLEELRQRLFRIMWSFLPLFIFYLTFTIRTVEVAGLPLPYPFPDFFGAISVQVVQILMDGLLPAFVERVQIAPQEAILVQFKVAFFLAVLTDMPYIVYQVAKFLSPGLYKHERDTILKITVPATLLFVVGVLFAYFLILPWAFRFLYGIGLRMGLTPLIRPDQFFNMVLLFFIGMGLSFQVPIIMWGLTALGIIDPAAWKRYWRYALVAFFVFGAVITPDGSGVTMLLVALPMTALYGAGYVVSQRKWRVRERPREPRRGRSSFAVWSVVIVLIAALAGGTVYYNRALFAGPLLVDSTTTASGSLTLTLPAFVLYAPTPFAGDVSAGAMLQVPAGATVAFRWSGLDADGGPLTFAPDLSDEGPLQAGEDAATLHVAPALWSSPVPRSLTFATTGGAASVYALTLEVDYDLVLQTEYQDRNRNGRLDGGERILGSHTLLAYRATPVSEAVESLGASHVPAPLPEHLLRLDEGIFVSGGAEWSLETSLRDLGGTNETFSYVQWVADPGLEDAGVRLFLTRTHQGSEQESLRLWIRGESPARFVYTWSVDLRFGSLHPAVEVL